MTQAIRERATIGPGGRVEIRHPDLPVGEEVDVILLVEIRGTQPTPMTSFLGQGKGCFGSAEEIDAFLESERDAWDS